MTARVTYIIVSILLYFSLSFRSDTIYPSAFPFLTLPTLLSQYSLHYHLPHNTFAIMCFFFISRKPLLGIVCGTIKGCFSGRGDFSSVSITISPYHSMPSQVSIQSWVCHANTASPLVFSIGENDGTPLQYSCLENPWMEEPGRLHAVHGVVKSRTRLSDFTFTFHFHALEKEMATHSSVLAWRITGTEEPGRRPSMGSHRVGHDWSDLAAAAAAVYCNKQKGY